MCGGVDAQYRLTFEQALFIEGLDAAGAYMTTEKLAEMRARVKRLGESSFREFQAERRSRTPQGEARRRQIERLDVDGDYAQLRLRSAPDSLDISRLHRTGDGWRIVER